MKFFAILLLLILPTQAFAAGARLGSGNGGSTAGSSRSTNITIPAGTDLLIISATRSILDTNSPTAPTSVTVNGVAATQVTSVPIAEQNEEWVRLYFYLTPPSGSQTIVVSGGGGTAQETSFLWAAYSGFSQTGQPDSSGKTDHLSTTALSVSTTVIGSKCWVFFALGNQGLTPTSYTNVTNILFAVPNNGAGISDSNATVPSGSYTVTTNQPSQQANGVAASFCEASINTFNPYYFWDF